MRLKFCSLALVVVCAPFYAWAQPDLCVIPGMAQTDPSAAAPLRRVKQLTHSPCGPAAIDFGDPSFPYNETSGRVTLYGADQLDWKAASNDEAWSRFLRAEPFDYTHIDVYHFDGVTKLVDDDDRWDMTIESFGTEHVLYAGVMTPPHGETHATFDRDNRTRRTTPFLFRNGRWVQQPHGLMFAPEQYGWYGHNYGHQFIRDESGQLWMFYERVTDTAGDGPAKTEMFQRRVVSPFELSVVENQIFKIPNPPYPAVVRGPNNVLAEGPRPFHAMIGGKSFYLVGFSSSQWSSDSYGVNFLWSEKIDGPYKAFLTPDGRDLRDFASSLRSKYNLTYGPGRPAVFQAPSGDWWMLFHAGDRRGLDANGEGDLYRNYFLAPVALGLDARAEPTISVGD